MVERQQDRVVLRSVAQDECTYGLSGREVERPGRLPLQQSRGVRRGGVDDRYGDGLRCREHFLVGLAVMVRVAGAQDPVAGHQ